MDKKEYKKQYYKDNKEHILENNKQWRIKNKEHRKEYMKQNYSDNIECRKKNMKEWYINNIEHARGYMKKWHINNPEYNKQRYLDNPEYAKQYYIDNREKLLEYRRQYYIKTKEYKKEYQEGRRGIINQLRNERRKTDLKTNLNHNISNYILHSLKENKKGMRWEKLVGYTCDTLIKHLKKTMPNGYCWEDYLSGKLHIDHIIPISVFSYNSPNDINFKHCWSLSNLQLLPAKENIKKSNHLYEPFQLLLKIQCGGD